MKPIQRALISVSDKTGVLEFAQTEADRLADESMAALDKLQVSEDGKNDFREVIRYVVCLLYSSAAADE